MMQRLYLLQVHLTAPITGHLSAYSLPPSSLSLSHLSLLVHWIPWPTPSSAEPFSSIRILALRPWSPTISLLRDYRRQELYSGGVLEPRQCWLGLDCMNLRLTMLALLRLSRKYGLHRSSLGNQLYLSIKELFITGSWLICINWTFYVCMMLFWIMIQNNLSAVWIIKFTQQLQMVQGRQNTITNIEMKNNQWDTYYVFINNRGSYPKDTDNES